MKRPIAISLAPNLEEKDILLALKLTFSPWMFFRGNYVRFLEQWFCQYFNIATAAAFNSGRSSLFAILKVAGIGKDDEVMIQSFTCVSVPNSIIWLGAKPVYVDITNVLTMDPEDLERKITKRTKAIIVQHTFGIPSKLNEILRIAKKHKLFLIEDCAHTIGGVYKGDKLGLFGDAAFFSFGRDKAFSSVFGGIAITNDKTLGQKLSLFKRNLEYPSLFWVLQQLLHPIAFWVILPFYNIFSLGKIILVFLQKLHLLSLPVSFEEKQGRSKPSLKKLPNALACLALFQLKRINEFNGKREEITRFYLKEFKELNLSLPYKNIAPLLRFPLFIEKRDEVMQVFAKKRIYLGKWYSEVIDPRGVDLKKMFYQRGSCPNAEFIAKKIINLPTYPTMTVADAEKVVELVKKCLG